MKQFGIDRKKISKTLRCALAIALTASVLTSVCACDKSATESSMEASIPDGTFAVDTVPSETTQVTSPTNETTETTVYVWNGHYYMEGDPAIEGKSVTAMTLSEAQSAGYTSGQDMPDDEKTAYDYNLAWGMVAQGKSDEEIIEALCTQGYSNEGAAEFMVAWVREDYANGIRAYEAPQNTSGNTGSSSSSSGSGSSGNSGSGSSGSSSGSSSGGSSSGGSSSGGSSSSGGNSGSGSSGGSSSGGSSSGGGSTQPTETQAPAPTETQAPAQTQPAATEPAQTQPAQTEPAPTETQAPTPTPVPPTPTPRPAPTITHYYLSGHGYSQETGEKVSGLSFTGSSADDCINQFESYCQNHNLNTGSYQVYAVYSDGSKKPA